MKKKRKTSRLKGCYSLEILLRLMAPEKEHKYYQSADSIRLLLIDAINEGEKKGLPNRDEQGYLADYIAEKLARLIHVYDVNGNTPPVGELEDGEF